jgi:signal peptidase II
VSDAPAPGAPERPHARLQRFEVALIAGIIVADQITKAAVRATIPLHDSITVIPGFLNLAHVRNTGAAFGFLNAVDFPYKAAVVALVATAALIGIAVYAARVSPNERVSRVGLGDLIDRLSLGSVVDFVDVVLGGWHFWAFNVADAAITLGVIAMMIDMIGLGRHVPTTS